MPTVWAISIDESGNLGKDPRYFVMAATVVMRQRHPSGVSNKISRHRDESMFYNSTETEITDVLEEVSGCNVSIVCVLVDKYDCTGKYYGIHGNDLYESVLRDLLNEAFSIVNKGDANVFLDRSSFVTLGSFGAIAKEIAIAKGWNLKNYKQIPERCGKGRSSLPGLFVAGVSPGLGFSACRCPP